MAPLVLEGNTLGDKHRHYNQLVNEALKSSEVLQPLDPSAKNDVQNLIKIDVACRNKNVDYIMEVLKSEDELYVSKAIKRATWLITDPKFAHIINPEYLYTELYPHMTLKAFNKLMLNVRLHLKDEKRVELFYDYIKEKDLKLAHKWLQHCSIPFVERVVKNTSKDQNISYDIEMNVLRRLFRKSFSVYESHITRSDYYVYRTEDPDFILRKYPLQLMDFLESIKDEHYHYRFGPKATEMIVKKYPERVLDKIELYGKYFHAASFAKHLKRIVNVEEFLLKHAKNTKLDWVYANDKIQHFIKQMPKETRFEFVRKVFIDKDDDKEDSIYNIIADRVGNQRKKRGQNTHIFMWYKFAPFEIACTDLEILIRAEPLPVLRSSMLQVLLSCAGRNTNHSQTVLQYYHDKHFNEAFIFKIQFVNYFISKVNTHYLDDQTWNLLYKLFHSMEVFIESQNNVQFCIQAIIVRNAIRNEPVPDIIEKKFVFDTLKIQQKKIKNQEDKDAVFKYLQNFITNKSNALNLTVESDFNEAVVLCEYLLTLIKDWAKDLHDHPNALAKVKELTKIKKKEQWNRDLSTLYNINKSWRREMFEDSIAMMQNEAVCVNAIKHDPGLLSRNKDQILSMCCDDTVSLRNMLRKMCVYWPHTLAEDWKTTYTNHLAQSNGHKALIDGLCAILSREEIDHLLKKHAPSVAKIDWYTIDQQELSLCKHIAKNIHKARSLPSIEGILLYAKGDYLQYAVPSINSVLSQLSPIKSRIYIPVLLNAPLSLKKFGLRSAIDKLDYEKLAPMLSDIWYSTKNTSIRAVIFTHTFQQLCKGKNTSYIKDTWKLLSMFIDKLTHSDSAIVFKNLGQFYRIPQSIQPYFFMKSLAVISSLPAKSNCKDIYDNMQYSALDYVEFFDDEFVVKFLLKNFKIFVKKRDTYDKQANFIPAYILASKDEETQINRYEKTLEIVLEQHLHQWETNDISRDWLKTILETLVSEMETYTFQKKMTIPLKVFEKILVRLENTLSSQKYYVFLTVWKLATAFVKVLKENEQVMNDFEMKSGKTINEDEKQTMFDVIHETTAPLFAKIYVQYLKEDIIQYGQSIYLLLANALRILLYSHLPGARYDTKKSLLYLKALVQCGNETELYLIVCHLIVKVLKNEYRFTDEEKKMCKEIYDIVEPHCSAEIKMHLNNVFKDMPFPVSYESEKDTK